MIVTITVPCMKRKIYDRRLRFSCLSMYKETKNKNTLITNPKILNKKTKATQKLIPSDVLMALIRLKDFRVYCSRSSLGLKEVKIKTSDKIIMTERTARGQKARPTSSPGFVAKLNVSMNKINEKIIRIISGIMRLILIIHHLIVKQ